MLQQRCPVCFQGAMFRGRFAMNPTCPVCGHRFEREPGFFQGAMYVSYGIGIVYLGILGLAANAFIVPRFGLVPAVGLVVAVHLACIPAVFRYSRVIWAHVNVRTMRP
jgi:uncharacterized protein (DUF983 family)